MTTLAVLVAAILFVWNYRGSSRSVSAGGPIVPIPKQPISLEGTTLGSPGAKVALVEFSDFQCPYCGKFATETLPKIKTKYIDKGLLRFVFRHNPIPVHARAQAAAEAAECAGRQGRFWEMHHQLFQDPKRLEVADLADYAQTVGLDLPAFKVCTAKGAKEHVQRDVELAKSLTLRGTPTFMVGTIGADGYVKVSEVIAGARPLAEFESSIDKILNVVEKTR